MLVVERIEKIKEILQKEKKVSVNFLASALHVSDVTIRKDLSKLEEEGYITKIHGGAILAPQKQKNITTKNEINITNLYEKQKIVKKAYSTIEKGESIFIGSGQTCYLLSQMIKKEDYISVVTNNISALKFLVPNCKNVMLIGGEIITRSGLMFSLGNTTNSCFDKIYVNKVFTSASGIDQNAGITVTNEFSAYIYKQIPKISNNWTLMIDNSKYDKIALFHVAPIDNISCIITDKVNQTYKNIFEKKQKTLYICE